MPNDTVVYMWYTVSQVRSRGLPDDFEGTEVRVVEIEGYLCVSVCLCVCVCVVCVVCVCVWVVCVCVCVCVHAHQQ